MRDGKHCSIRLNCSRKDNGVVYYRIQARRQDSACSVELRYSELRKLAKLLPRVWVFFMQSRVAFPEPRHITSIVSQLTGSVAFLQERESELTRYFQAVSNESGLEESIGFAQIFLEGTVETMANEGDSMVPPPAPKIVGRKLSAREVESIC